jgi:extradiol dioxygenase family protein
MKRFHIHMHVQNLSEQIKFYSAMFNQAPAREEADYAKWMLQDPPLNFAISTRGDKPGVDHMGIQVDTDEELQTLKTQAKAADMALLDEGETSCCYAQSDKYWLTDPDGNAWEQFRTLGNIPVYGEHAAAKPGVAGACCAQPAMQTVAISTSIPVKTKAGACC